MTDFLDLHGISIADRPETWAALREMEAELRAIRADPQSRKT